jgi:hypothetical protein
MYAPTPVSSSTSRSKRSLTSTSKFSARMQSSNSFVWGFDGSTTATTFSSLWKGIGIVGAFTERGIMA